MKHILIVDDNKTNLITAKTVLSEHYKVTAVPMGSQALKYLENNSCDMILLDIDMPEMNGFEVIRKIKERQMENEPPVLFLTGNTEPEILSQCIEEGGMDVMEKPFVNNVLLNRLSLLFEVLEARQRFAKTV